MVRVVMVGMEAEAEEDKMRHMVRATVVKMFASATLEVDGLAEMAGMAVTGVMRVKAVLEVVLGLKLKPCTLSYS